MFEKLPQIPTPKSVADVADLIRKYQQREFGYGLLRIFEAVRDSVELPLEVKRKFMWQFASGMIYPEDFGV